MATSGDLSRSQAAASDVVHDFSCSPCAKDSKNSEAEFHCVECKTDFCSKCVQFHNKFLGSHTLLDKTTLKSGQSRKQLADCSTLPMIMCKEHRGEFIKMFCPDHDDVCCTVCIAVKHRSCDGVEYIPKIVEGQLKGQEKQKTVKSLEQVRQQLQDLLSKRQNDIKLLNEQHDECVKDIKDLKERIVKKVENLERESIKQVNSTHKLRLEREQNDIQSIDDMLTMTGVKLDNINQTNTDSETELFINVKQGQRQTSETEDFLKTAESKEYEPIIYKLNTEIERVFGDTQSFVTIHNENKRTLTSYTATFFGSYDIAVKTCQRFPYISDCCISDNGYMIIIDNNNDMLKRLNASFRVTDIIDIPGSPYGVCKTGQSEVAVTLQKAGKVQFVSVGMTLRLSRSFSVGKSCKGICCVQGKLCICCGEGNEEDPAQIKVYDIMGSVLRIFQKDQSGEDLFGYPSCISADHSSLKLYIADENKGVVTIDTKGNQFPIATDASLNDITGVTVDCRGNVFACDFSLNTVQINQRGNVLRAILSKANGIKSPLSVTFLKIRADF